MASRTARILYALYLLIISVVLLAEATVAYVTNPFPIALFQITRALGQIIWSATNQVILQTIILFYFASIIVAILAYWSFFILISRYAMSLAPSPEAHVLDRRWLFVGLSLGFIVMWPLVISLLQSVFPSVHWINPYLAIPIIILLLVLGRKSVYECIQWGSRHALAYWGYVWQRKEREVKVVFLFAFITYQASLIGIQLPTVVYYAFFLFVIGYTASVALFPEIRTLDKLWLSLGMSLALLLLTPLILRIVAPSLYIQLPSTPEILTLVTVVTIFAVLVKRLATS